MQRERPTLLIEIEQTHNRIPIEESIARVCAYGYRMMFLWKGTLSDASHFDATAHHDPANRADYIFNFIFFPTR